MSKAKAIIIQPIHPKRSRTFIERNHYSGKCTPHSQLHFGAFINNQLEGVLQYGPPLDRKRMQGIIVGGKMRDMLELNRMAFTDKLPRNSESRAIAITLRLIKKYAPHVRFIVSYADATQCGDGQIYRAAGFMLSAIKENKNLFRLPNGTVIHKMGVETTPNKPRKELDGKTYFDITGGKFTIKKYIEYTNAEVLTGHHIRYIKILDPTAELTTPPLPYSTLKDLGIQMYKGMRASEA